MVSFIVLGLAGLLGSIFQVIGPLLGGYLIREWGPDWLSLTGGILMSVVLFLMLRKNSHQSGVIVTSDVD